MKAKKIVVNQTIQFKAYSKVCALGKARDDVNRTLSDCGYDVEIILCKRYPVPFLSNLMGLLKNMAMILRHPLGSEYVMQYPVSSKVIFPWVLRLQRLLGNKVTILVHDIQTVRNGRDLSPDLRVFRLASRILTHTEAMSRWIHDHGVATPSEAIQLFDYYTDDDFRPKEDLLRHKKEIAFAGYLRKSSFFTPLSAHDFRDLTFNLYGKTDDDFRVSGNVRYLGVFESNHTAAVEGGWGLVWDGTSIDTCEGDLGDYLRLIASHKLSLYLAMGIPVIVWKDSAEAEFVTREGLGIAVSGLKELPDRISAISDEEYGRMLDRCRAQGSVLRRGGMLKKRVNGMDGTVCPC